MTSTDPLDLPVSPRLGPAPVDPPAARFRVALWRARRLLGVAGLAALALVVVRVVAPAPPVTVPVVVTTTQVAAGTPLDATMLRVARVDPASAPTGRATSVEPVLGRAPLVPLPVGLPVVEEVLVGDRFAVEPPPGTVVVAVRLADPAVTGLLRPGDRVDLVTAAAAEDGSEVVAADVVAREALVLDRAAVNEDAGPLGLGGGSGTAAVLTVVAVPPDDGRRLAAVVGWADLGAVLVG
nr:RcpC/CpaB family pilus assembly protein [uncultured Actinotalea sp.]